MKTEPNIKVAAPGPSSCRYSFPWWLSDSNAQKELHIEDKVTLITHSKQQRAKFSPKKYTQCGLSYSTSQ